MQWDASEFAGFSAVEPWLPLADDFRSANVETQRVDPSSILNLYRRLIAARRRCPALSLGSYRPILTRAETLIYVRELGRQPCHGGAQPRRRRRRCCLPVTDTVGTVLMSCFGDREGEELQDRIDLRGNEGLVDRVAERRSPPFAQRHDSGWLVDVAALEQIVEPADAVPAIAVGSSRAVPAVAPGTAVILGEQVDQQIVRFVFQPDREISISRGLSSRLCTNSTELLRQS